MGKIFYIMGKSAAGKDKIYSMLAGDNKLCLKKLILYTTRPVRDGEKNGREYYFTDENKLKEFKDKGIVIESRSYDTIHGVWTYFTADDGQINLNEGSYLGIGTLESFCKMKEYYGEDVVVPIYIEVEDGERLIRAIRREQEQENPKYKELCRRFIADSEDFAEEKIKAAGINRRFVNDKLDLCVESIINYVNSMS